MMILIVINNNTDDDNVGEGRVRGLGQPHAPGDRGGGGQRAACQVKITMIMILMVIMMITGRDIGSMSWPPLPPGASTSGTSWAGRGPSEGSGHENIRCW